MWLIININFPPFLVHYIIRILYNHLLIYLKLKLSNLLTYLATTSVPNALKKNTQNNSFSQNFYNFDCINNFRKKKKKSYSF